MTNREKVLNLMEGKSMDELIWAPRMKLWQDAHERLGTLPEKYRDKSLIEVEKMLGAVAADSARLSWVQRDIEPEGQIMQTTFDSVEVEKNTEGTTETITYKTPIGTVTEAHSINVEAVKKGFPMQKHQSEHLIKEEKDYEIVEYIYNDISYVPTYEAYLDFENSLNNHGVPVVHLDRDPMYLIMQNLIGYNQFFYEFYDRKKKVDHLYEVLCEKAKEFTEIAIHSPAKILLAAYHYDGRMVSPQFYNEYFKPFLKPFAKELIKRDKYIGFHADADVIGLMDTVLDTGLIFMDCFITAPMVSTTLKDALKKWEDKVVIYGGVPSNLLLPSICSDADFEDFLKDMFQTIKDYPCRILLGVADNVMPEVDFSRVERIAEMVEDFKM